MGLVGCRTVRRMTTPHKSPRHDSTTPTITHLSTQELPTLAGAACGDERTLRQYRSVVFGGGDILQIGWGDAPTNPHMTVRLGVPRSKRFLAARIYVLVVLNIKRYVKVYHRCRKLAHRLERLPSRSV